MPESFRALPKKPRRRASRGAFFGRTRTGGNGVDRWNALKVPLVLAGLLAVLVASFAPLPTIAQGGAQSTADEAAREEAFRRISNKLMCQCGTCNYTVLSCNHVDCPSSKVLRKMVSDGLARGQSEEVILAGFVQDYGVKILMEPPRHGFTLLAWVMPFVALLLGGGAVAYVIRRWRMLPRLESGDTSPADSVTPSSQLRARATPSAAAAPSAPAIANPELEAYRAQINRDLEDEE